MIYEEPPAEEPLTQGDILDDCPVFRGEPRDLGDNWVSPTQASPVIAWTAKAVAIVRVVVLTQACDLANAKSSGVLVAAVHEADRLKLNDAKRKEVRALRKYGWYLLPSGQRIQESIVDLRDLHTVPLTTL